MAFGALLCAGRALPLRCSYAVRALSAMPVIPRVAVFSSVGRRRDNEDRVVHCVHALTGADVIAVFDGHGGDFAAEFLSQTLCSAVAELTDPFDTRALSAVFDTLDEQLLHRLRGGPPSTAAAGSTALVAVIEPTRIAVAHVGDTRAVLVHRNQTHALTSSHTPYRVDECVRVKAGGGSISWVGVPRVNGKLAVTRAFCALSMRGAGIIATPEIKFITLNPDETAAGQDADGQFSVSACQALVLGTDGLFEMLTDQQVAATVLAQESAATATEALVDEALAMGTRDNISGAVVRLAGWQRMWPSKQERVTSTQKEPQTGAWFVNGRH